VFHRRLIVFERCVENLREAARKRNASTISAMPATMA
jgi:hypothetical protein